MSLISQRNAIGLQDEQLLLQKVLFRETTSKLVYEKFKEVLLRLIEGTLTDQHADQGFEPAVDYSLIQFENDSLDGESAPKNYYQSTRNGIDNNRNDTDFLDRKRRDSLGSPEAYSPGQPDSTDFHSQNALLLDFDPLFDNAKENYRKTSTPQISSLPLSLTKKYGRSSSPDESLFQDDATFVYLFLARSRFELVKTGCKHLQELAQKPAAKLGTYTCWPL